MSGGIIVCPGCETKLRLKSVSRSEISCPRCGEQIAVDDLELEQSPPPPAERPWHNVAGALGSKSGGRGGRTSGSQPRRSRPAGTQRSIPAPAPRRSEPEPPLDDVEEYDPFDDVQTVGTSHGGRTSPFEADAADGSKSRMLLVVVLGIGGFLAVSTALGFAAMQLFGGSDQSETGTVADTGGSDSVIRPEVADVPSTAADSVSVERFREPEAGEVPAAPDNPPPDRSNDGRVAGGIADNGIPDRDKQRPEPNNPAARPPGDRLVYNWKTGDEFVYSVEITAETDTSTEVVSGNCTYKVGQKGGLIVDDQEGSGTGFAVTENGYIATCAHVVEDATEIEVTLGRRSWPATVVATDFANDLALLKVQASGLSPLPFADSDSLQLAQTVRVIGYPLSDVLGQNIKVTTGTISGIGGTDDRGERIQVDASINPGNSGGPLFNEFGQVIGVASSKLAGSVVSDVGFAVPVNALRQMLQDHAVTPASEAAGPKLTGPQVVQKVSPSVAYISVKGGGGGDAFQLTFSAQLTQSSRPKQNRFPSFAPPSHTMENGRLQVNKYGEVQDFDGEEHLPFALGPIGIFFIEKLDPLGQNTWCVEDESSLQRIKRNDRFGGMFGPRFRPPAMPPGFGPRGLDPFGRDQDEVVDTIPAIETTTYRLGAERNNRVTVEKEYLFTTTRDRNAPAMRIRGKGEVVFDRTIGMPQKLEYRATIEDNDEDGNTTMPITVTYTLRDMEVVKAEGEAARKRMEEMRAQQELQKTEPNADLVTSLLEDIRVAEGGHGAWSPMRKLGEIAIVEERRDDVLRVIRNHLRNSNSSVRDSAVKALFHWSDGADIDELLKVLDDKDTNWPLKRELLPGIAELKDPKALPSILESLNENTTRTDAGKALVVYGEAAEDAVLEALTTSTDLWTRRELVDVLKKIGTEKSIPPLEKIAAGKDFSAKSSAQRALDAIRARL